MALTTRQAFKFGFLLKCAEAGLSTQQIQQHIDAAIEKLSFDPIGMLTDAGKLGLGGVGLALSGAGITGALGGYGLAKATEPDADPEEAKMQELIATYKQYADQARRNAARFTMRPATHSTGPRFNR